MRDTDSDNATLTRIADLQAQGWGDRRIAEELGETRHFVRAAFLQIARRDGEQRALAVVQPRGAVLELYDAACRALAEATAINDVLPLLDQIDHVKLHAKKVKDRQLLADAAAFQQKAERRLGQVIIAARDAGHFLQGHRAKSSDEELLSRATLAEVGVDRKLSARAQNLAALDEQAFKQSNQALRERIASGAATVIDKETATAEKRQRRDAREKILGAIQTALPTAKYGVIVADPEWRFEPWSRTSGMDRAADNHYPTSCLEVIKARDVPSIAADDCVLFLWATAPMLPHALAVMEAWGFEYKSQVVWNKTRDGNGHGLRKLAVGTGYWFRNAHELLLLGTRGNIPAPAPGTQWTSTIDAPLAEHSAKPEVFLEMIEQYFPTLPKIELNRRGPARPGWAAWGNEAESTAAPIDADAATERPAPDLPHEDRVGPGPLLSDEDLSIPACLRRDQQNLGYP